MQPRLFQTAMALYVIEEWNGENNSGMTPINNLVLVRPDECAQFSAGGVRLPDETRENHSLASETGFIVDVGSQAFKITLDGRRWPDDDPKKPKIGDRVWFKRYSGSEHSGYDNRLYRLINDSNVGAIFSVEGAPYIAWPENVTEDWQFPTVAGSGEIIGVENA